MDPPMRADEVGHGIGRYARAEEGKSYPECDLLDVP
jgi:hypothetical protein